MKDLMRMVAYIVKELEKDYISKLEDILDVTYIANSDRTYLGAEVLFTCGGPTIYLDTRTNCVIGHWGRDKYEREVNKDVVDSLNDYLEDLYNSI